MPVIASALLVSALVQDTKTFQDKDLNLIFQYPAAWTAKKEKYSTDLHFTSSDGSMSVVQIFNIQYRQEKPLWHQLQREVADSMRRRVTRQWEEQILGVPLLLTRIDYVEAGKDVSTLVGLLYTATRDKLNFRLNTTSGAAQEAENAWRQVLLSLRTIDGELPQPEDPTKPLPNPGKTASGQTITRLTPDSLNGGPVRTKNVHRISKLGLQLNVFLPDGWLLESKDDRTLLTTEKLGGTVELHIVSGGRQQVPGVLRDANSASFSRFGLVRLRDDPVPAVMRSGSYVASTLRIGSGASGGEAVAWHIVGTLGTVVWRIDYSATSEIQHKADKKLIERLIDLTAVETAQ